MAAYSIEFTIFKCDDFVLNRNIHSKTLSEHHIVRFIEGLRYIYFKHHLICIEKKRNAIYEKNRLKCSW